MAIEQETFQGDSLDPMTYGVNRNEFLCQKYQRLIALAKKTPGLGASNKLQQWNRQLGRAGAAKARFETLRAETISRPSLRAASPPTEFTTIALRETANA